MDCRTTLICLLAVFLMLVLSVAEGRNKKVVIHVPYKVKKIKHTHTVYKTIHHHHKHREPLLLESMPVHALPASEEHEHFHHVHMHEEPAQHSQPVPGLGIPEFLPDVPIDMPDIPDVPMDMSPITGRHHVTLFRRVAAADEDDELSGPGGSA